MKSDKQSKSHLHHMQESAEPQKATPPGIGLAETLKKIKERTRKHTEINNSHTQAEKASVYEEYSHARKMVKEG